jgi:hypothetical protein
VDDEMYVGSTCNHLRIRKGEHKSKSKTKPRPVHHHLNSVGWENVEIILIESYECKTKDELHKRERYWIDELKPLLNRNIPTRTQIEYQEDNKEAIAKTKKMYREKNKESIAEKMKVYQQENKESIAVRKKTYLAENKEWISAKQKTYQQENKESIAANKKDYHEKNKESLAAKGKVYYEKNKELISTKCKVYHENNKEQRCQYQRDLRKTPAHIAKEKIRCSIQITCDCGKTLTKKKHSQHLKSAQHIRDLEQKNNDNVVV